MNNQTQEQFVGKIIHRQKKKVHDKQSQYFQQISYKLIVKSDNFIEEEQKLFAYANKLNPNIWTAIENKQYLDKRYYFTAQKSKWGWILLDWKEINL